MTKKITFSAFGRDSYYHRDWFKKNGFKFDRSSKKWTVENLNVDNAEDDGNDMDNKVDIDTGMDNDINQNDREGMNVDVDANKVTVPGEKIVLPGDDEL